MPEIDLSFIAAQLERVLREQAAQRAEVADFRADMEVQSAILRRIDARMDGLALEMRALTGEVRALGGQQDRQRQKLDRLRERVDKLDEALPA